ncbi:hyaluronidase-like [Pollicipes pollicipes]|uniref:hyaluronidase-like n=1 Tax=Pollicipes pollicipes TaxID=41117 RepID=UPI0018849669|nr:hyaluronidase-like [Pollicipes pollicipes]
MSKEYHRLQTKLGAIPHLDNVTAEALFERASRPFLERTLQVARELRPDALWGYYHYPYCKNYQPHVDYCAPAISADNDRSQWIYNNSVALYPSVYLLKHNYTSWDKNVQTRVILEETDRLATKAGGRPVYPYTWFGYHEVVNDYLSPGDLLATIGQVVTRQPAGLIIWGGSSNVNSSRLCRQLRDYVTFRLGPFIRWMLSRTERQLQTLARRLAAGPETFNAQVALLERQGVFGSWPVTAEAAARRRRVGTFVEELDCSWTHGQRNGSVC